MKCPGGKGHSFQKFINLMPPHEVYIETHLGGGAIISNKRPARRNIGIPHIFEKQEGAKRRYTNTNIQESNT